MVDPTGYFSHLGKCKVAVVGDLLFDSYTIGKASRISPEGPVPVVHVQKEESLPGGAGNVILNLVSLGAEVVAIGRVGNDHAGRQLLTALEAEGVDTLGIIEQDGYATPVKNRIIADNQQVVRLDHECITQLPEIEEEAIVQKLPSLLQDITVLAISDYGKGFLTDTLLVILIEEALRRGIKVIVDPKGIDYSKYHGAHLIKPNQAEAYAAAMFEPTAPIEAAAKKLLEITGAQTVMVTRSKEGISLFNSDGTSEHFPVRVREVKDVTGAGDTVLAMLTVAIANGLPLAVATAMSNLAASVAIEKVGCARVTLAQLAAALFLQDAGNKVFDEEHLFALQHFLEHQPFSVIALSETTALTPELHQSLKQASESKKLVVYLKDASPSTAYISMLSSQKEISCIVLKSSTLKPLDTATELFLFENNSLLSVNDLSSILS